ncbi:4-alpha-L-fucosyltransferase [Halomonas beimenensis]|uniref:4-alpha-L-fucosyltransferase n=1 Tax=Halomonas beimenensis TaxID=475662 RepID=A0A291P737_9GAMM|nr:4-alpha-L-fucosyltransferase [Halomonas beimenensis]
MILHVAGLDKFIPPFIRLVEENFKKESHRFWLGGVSEVHKIESKKNVYLCRGSHFKKIKAYIILVLQLHAARKVMLHGLFNIRLVLLLALCPWLLPKCYWVIWGGDLYQYKNATKTWRSRVNETLRHFVISRIGHLVTYIEGDVELARQWYGAKGIHHECIMYPSNVFDPSMIAINNEKKRNNGPLTILVGNSADPSNNHIEALERLLPFKDKNILIFVPLSYGDQGHAKKIIAKGKAWFGEKLVPMTEFMRFEQYLSFLQSIDVAVFNHRRQQAMGNTITLLGMGKTVFMRSDVSHWRFLVDLGIKLNDVEDLSLQALGDVEAQKNASIVHSYFSKTTLVKQFLDIFEG